MDLCGRHKTLRQRPRLYDPWHSRQHKRPIPSVLPALRTLLGGSKWARERMHTVGLQHSGGNSSLGKASLLKKLQGHLPLGGKHFFGILGKTNEQTKKQTKKILPLYPGGRNYL